MADALFNMNLDEEEETKEPETPMDEYFHAILDNDIETVRQKLATGFSPHSVSQYDDMALHFAVLNSRVDVICAFKDYFHEYDINKIHVSKDETECGTALHVAMDGQVATDMLPLLIRFGADINSRDIKGSPVLHALIHSAWEDFETEFSWEETGNEAGSDIYRQVHHHGPEEDEDFSAPKGYSYIKKLRILHESGADMNIIDVIRGGLSPLHKWCQMFVHFTKESFSDGNTEWLTWAKEFLITLLQNGANPNIPNEIGELAISHFAQRHYKPQHIEYTKRYKELVTILLGKMTNLCEKDIHERTLLHLASEFTNIALMEKLLEHGLDVNVKDHFGLTPLHLITHNINADEVPFVIHIMTLLLDHGAEIDAQDNYGSTPSHHAIHLKNLTAVQFLLEHNASREVTDCDGRDIGTLASIEGDLIIQRLFGLSSDVETGKSDCRFGWYYPLCCHKLYDGSSRGIEDPVTIHIDSIKDWLEQYPLCEHNRKVIIQNSVSVFESNKEQMQLTEKDRAQIAIQVFESFSKIAENVGQMSPILQCTVLIGGSISEDTKVGSPDEMDLVFDLFKLGQMVTIVEDARIPGFVKLKAKNSADFSGPDLESLLDDEDFLKRSEVSKLFHQNIEKCIKQSTVWKQSSLLVESEILDWEGECFNIGQLKLIWYGPFLKRQNISVDIVPGIRVLNWRPSAFRNDVTFIEHGTTNAIGCCVIMKQSIGAIMSVTEREWVDVMCDEEALTLSDRLFMISFSQLEHAVMRYIPSEIKNGYQIAKSIQLSCPVLQFRIAVQPDSDIPESLHEKIIEQHPVHAYISSYILKTALFHELHHSGRKISFKAKDLQPDLWNSRIINELLVKDLKQPSAHIKESLQWTLRIYKRLLYLCDGGTYIPHYFLGTKVNPKALEGEAILQMREYCRTILHILSDFEIPSEFFETDITV